MILHTSLRWPPAADHPPARWDRSDVIFLGLFVATFAVILHWYGFVVFPSEWDLYLTTIGLWDGFHHGTGLASPAHYGKWYSYGYLLLVMALSKASDFASMNALYALLNTIGFWSTLLCLPTTWWAVRSGYGRRIAWPTTILFILSPGFLEIAGGTHPVLLAIALLMAGTAILWSSPRGKWAGLWYFAAFVAFSMSLVVRLEVILAFPLVVLGPGRAGSWREYIGIAASRLIPTGAACVAFFALRSILVPTVGVQTTEFVQQWYSIDKIPEGIVGVVLATGIASFGLAIAGFGWAASLPLRRPSPDLRTGALIPMIAPSILAGLTLVFWLMNPLPARHFILFVFAAALIASLWLGARFRSTARLAGIALLIAAANQLLSAAANPLLIDVTGYAQRRGWPYLLTAPSGDAWSRREMLKEKWDAAVAQGKRVAEGACGDHVVISAMLSPPIGAALLEKRPYRLTAGAVPSDHGDRVPFDKVTRPGQMFIVLERSALTEPPFPSKIKNNPDLRLFNFVEMPDSTALPANCRF